MADLNYDAFRALAPAADSALVALGRSPIDAGLEPSLSELVKLRASQINRCAFCTQFHLNNARKAGVSAVKLDGLVVWRAADVFSTRERIALAWAEALTAMANDIISPDTYGTLMQHFSETEAVNLSVAIASANAWNRICGGLRFPPAAPLP